MDKISTLEFAPLVQALFIVGVLLVAWMARLRSTRAISPVAPTAYRS